MINARLGSLQEVVTFPGKEILVVNSSLVVSDEDARLRIKLKEATLQLPGRALKLPALGGGW